jgi:hypothetical protein
MRITCCWHKIVVAPVLAIGFASMAPNAAPRQPAIGCRTVVGDRWIHLVETSSHSATATAARLNAIGCRAVPAV